MACCASCNDGGGCKGSQLGAIGPRSRAARKVAGYHLPGMLCPPGQSWCFGRCRPFWQCVNWPSQHLAGIEDAATVEQWWQILFGGQLVGWFWGTSGEAAALGGAKTCEHVGPTQCLPFPGYGDPFRARYWQTWHGSTFGGWLHGDTIAANLVTMQGGYTIVPATTAAALLDAVPAPPIGRPTGTAPPAGEHDVPQEASTSRWLAAGLGAALAVGAVVLAKGSGA